HATLPSQTCCGRGEKPAGTSPRPSANDDGKGYFAPKPYPNAHGALPPWTPHPAGTSARGVAPAGLWRESGGQRPLVGSRGTPLGFLPSPDCPVVRPASKRTGGECAMLPRWTGSPTSRR